MSKRASRSGKAAMDVMIPTFTEDEILYFPQKTAIGIAKRYCCAKCYHEEGLATQLHMVQVPIEDVIDRFKVICTECGLNVAAQGVGRITTWYLHHRGAMNIERAYEIKEYNRRLERERQKEAGTYHFDPVETIKKLGF